MPVITVPAVDVKAKLAVVMDVEMIEQVMAVLM